MVWRGICRHSENLDRIEHPTQKPVALMSWMMGLLGIAGTVLDPYMGSGTTGIACLRTGRRFIGVEKLRRYFEVAKNRLEAELRKLSPIFMLEEEGCWDSSI